MIPSKSLVLLAAATLLCSVGAAAADSMKSADMPKESKPMDAMPKDGMSKDSMAKDSMPMDAMSMPPGLKIGDKAPAFTLKDATGKEVSLASLLARDKVALVFYRSADWCPFCIAQLKELQANLGTIEQAGVKIVGISYDSVDVLARSATKHGLTFALLSDEGSKTIDAYGIRNQEAKGKGVGVPHPAIFILDQKGVVRASLRHETYRTRPTPAEIIAAAKDIM